MVNYCSPLCLNSFAIAGLRSLFGVLAKAVQEMKYLEKVGVHFLAVTHLIFFTFHNFRTLTDRLWGLYSPLLRRSWQPQVVRWQLLCLWPISIDASLLTYLRALFTYDYTCSFFLWNLQSASNCSRPLKVYWRWLARSALVSSFLSTTHSRRWSPSRRMRKLFRIHFCLENLKCRCSSSQDILFFLKCFRIFSCGDSLYKYVSLVSRL